MTAQDLDELFKRDLGKLKAEIEQYPSDESLWVVADGIANSGGNLCAHLCGNLRHFIGHNLANDGYVRDRDKEFSVKDLTKSQLISEIEQTIDSVSAALNKLRENDLDGAYPDKVPIPDSSNRLILLHLYAHLSYHLGQVNYHRRLLA